MSQHGQHITVLGSVNLDFIIQTQTLPRAGETIGQGTFTTLPGGKGANVALMVQRLVEAAGGQVSLRACVGDDVYAGQALAFLQEAGVDLTGVSHLQNEATGVAFINVSADGENQIAVASGANFAFTPEHIGELKTDAIITQFEIPTDVILAAVKATDAFVCINASPVGVDIAPLLPFTDLLIVNAGEHQAYEKSLEGYEGWLAVTLGGEGAVLYKGGEQVAQSQPPSVDVVDTTGAGDSFAAALTVAFLESKEPQAALDFACAVGALTTTKMGAQAAAPHRDAVDALLQGTNT